MLKEAIFVVAVCLLAAVSIWGAPSNYTKKKVNKTRPVYKYPELFRDHVYYQLSPKGKELFHAVNIHPDCVAKKGQCIERIRCVGRDMLYISRICYHWDLVCCYENAIRFPETAFNAYQPPTPANVSKDVYIEPDVLP